MALAEIDPAIMDSDLIEDWLAQVLNECNLRARKYRDHICVKTLSVAMRSTMWTLSTGAQLTAEAIPWHACRILEEYFQNCCDKMHEELTRDKPSFSTYEKRVTHKITLLIAAALWISAKFKFNARFIEQILNATPAVTDATYTASDLKKAEREILLGIKFEIPLWGALQVSFLLAARVGLFDLVQGYLPVAVNVAELYRAEIDQAVESQTKGSIMAPNGQDVINCVTDLHLAAGCVAHCVLLQHLDLPSEDDHIFKLAGLTYVPTHYIQLIAKLVSDHILMLRGKLHF